MVLRLFALLPQDRKFFGKGRALGGIGFDATMPRKAMLLRLT
jgi:hypothetical protein